MADLIATIERADGPAHERTARHINELLAAGISKALAAAAGTVFFLVKRLRRKAAGEDPVAGALRELKEETGAVPDTFLPMGVTLPSPGCLSERLYLFLAKGLHMESQQLDEDEFLNVERIPFNEMVHRVMDGEIEDSKTIAAVLKAKVLLNL